MSIEDKIKTAKPTSWLTEGIPKWKVWLIVKWARLRAKITRRRKMKNCSKCARMMNNFDVDGKIFKCGRNSKKQFDFPELHGWCCKHYVNKVIKNKKEL